MNKLLLLYLMIATVASSFSQNRVNNLENILKLSINAITQDSILHNTNPLLLSIQGFEGVMKKQTIENVLGDDVIIIEYLSQSKIKKLFNKLTNQTVLALKNIDIQDDATILMKYEIQSRKYYGKKHKGKLIKYSIAISSSLEVMFKYDYDLKTWCFLHL